MIYWLLKKEKKKNKSNVFFLFLSSSKQNKCDIVVNNQACNNINKIYKFQEVHHLTNLHYKSAFFIFILFPF